MLCIIKDLKNLILHIESLNPCPISLKLLDISSTLLDFINGESNKKVRELVQDGLTYLDKRADFWRQQKPLYARKKDKQSKEAKKYATRDQAAVKKLSKFMKKLEEIDAGMKSFGFQLIFKGRLSVFSLIN